MSTLAKYLSLTPEEIEELVVRINVIEDAYYELAAKIVARAQAMENDLCQICDCQRGDHRGCDDACPYPYRFHLGEPLYIEGQFFKEKRAFTRYQHSEYLYGSDNSQG